MGEEFPAWERFRWWSVTKPDGTRTCRVNYFRHLADCNKTTSTDRQSVLSEVVWSFRSITEDFLGNDIRQPRDDGATASFKLLTNLDGTEATKYRMHWVLSESEPTRLPTEVMRFIDMGYGNRNEDQLNTLTINLQIDLQPEMCSDGNMRPILNDVRKAFIWEVDQLPQKFGERIKRVCGEAPKIKRLYDALTCPVKKET